jgi:hypothetical protein
MAIPLEDNFTDIVGKAQRGLGISDSQLAERSGLDVEKYEACVMEILMMMFSNVRLPS